MIRSMAWISTVALLGAMGSFYAAPKNDPGMAAETEEAQVTATEPYTDPVLTKTALPLSPDYLGANFSGGEIAYQLDRAIVGAADTFECTIRIEKNDRTVGHSGVVFGNYDVYNSNSTNNNYINYEIDGNGRVCLNWMKTQYTFTETDVRTGEWIHLVVVRDVSQGKLKLYLNGELDEELDECPVSEPDTNFYRQRIGCDMSSAGEKHPFRGEIAQVALFSRMLSAEEIADDYRNVEKVSYLKYGGDLIFGVFIELGDEILRDASVSCNNARIISNDYYFDGEFFPTGDYSILVCGDPQQLTEHYPEGNDSMVNWALEHAEQYRVRSFLFMGDMVNTSTGYAPEETDRECVNISTSLSALDGKLPYIVIPGNHDYHENSTTRSDLNKFNECFPASKFKAQSWYAGAYRDGETQNTYYTVNYCGIDYLFLALEFGPERPVMEWACRVIEQHPDHRVVVMTHGFLNTAGELYEDTEFLSAYWYFNEYCGYRPAETVSAGPMWRDYLSRYSNVFMILCGHSAEETVVFKLLEGRNGNKVMAFRFDFSLVMNRQSFESILSLLTFHEAEQTLYINTFSTQKGMMYDIQNQMKINYGTYTRLTNSYYYGGKLI